MSSNEQQPGMVSGHATYAKGAAEELIGKATGSEEWKRSGASDKEAGISEMRDANENRDGASQGYGKVEKVLGDAVGCEGMQEEGAKSQQQS